MFLAFFKIFLSIYTLKSSFVQSSTFFCMAHRHFNAASLCIYLYFHQPQATKGQRATEQRKDFQCVLFLSLSRGENNKNVHECFRNKDAPTTPPLHLLSPKVCQNPREQDTSKDGMEKKGN